MARGTDDELTGIVEDTKRLTQRIDRLRRSLDARPRLLLTPVQYQRVGAALERLSLAGAALLVGDLAKTYAAESEMSEGHDGGPIDGGSGNPPWTDGG